MILIPYKIILNLTRNEKITIRVLEGELLKELGKYYHLSTTRIRAIVLQTVLKYDKNNPNIKNLSGGNLYPYSGDLAKLREQKDYLIYLITKDPPIDMSKEPLMLSVHLTDEEEADIIKEIVEGKRPRHWANLGHPDHTVWQMMLTACKDAGIQKRI